MKLVDLEAYFIGHGGEGISYQGHPVPYQRGVGVMMNCPCGCEDLLYVPFANPLEGSNPDPRQGWQRTGDTIETLTLTPSVQRIGGCRWHGWITNGQAVTC